MSVVGRVHGRAVLTRRVRVLGASIASLLPPGARVLDVGTGDGSVAATVLRHRPDVELVGIDVLVRPSTQIRVESFDGKTIPYGDGSFDAVTLVDVLHHADDPGALLAEAVRVGPGATVVKDHLVDGVLARPVLRAMDWFGNASHGVSLPYNYWTRQQWQQAFSEQQLRVTAEITRLGLYPPPASWVFERRLHVLWRLAASRDGHVRSSSAGRR